MNISHLCCGWRQGIVGTSCRHLCTAELIFPSSSELSSTFSFFVPDEMVDNDDVYFTYRNTGSRYHHSRCHCPFLISVSFHRTYGHFAKSDGLIWQTTPTSLSLSQSTFSGYDVQIDNPNLSPRKGETPRYL